MRLRVLIQHRRYSDRYLLRGVYHLHSTFGSIMVSTQEVPIIENQPTTYIAIFYYVRPVQTSNFIKISRSTIQQALQNKKLGRKYMDRYQMCVFGIIILRFEILISTPAPRAWVAGLVDATSFDTIMCKNMAMRWTWTTTRLEQGCE